MLVKPWLVVSMFSLVLRSHSYPTLPYRAYRGDRMPTRCHHDGSSSSAAPAPTAGTPGLAGTGAGSLCDDEPTLTGGNAGRALGEASKAATATHNAGEIAGAIASDFPALLPSLAGVAATAFLTSNPVHPKCLATLTLAQHYLRHCLPAAGTSTRRPVRASLSSVRQSGSSRLRSNCRV